MTYKNKLKFDSSEGMERFIWVHGQEIYYCDAMCLEVEMDMKIF